MLSTEQKHQIRDSIQAQLIVLDEQLAMTGQSAKVVELDQALVGRVSRIDAIQQQKIAEAGHARALLQLSKLNKAIVLLDSEDYGYCLECGEDIGFARLQIKPESSFCVGCKQAKE